MALNFSTGLRNALASQSATRHVATLTATTISAEDNGASPDTISDSGNGFLTAGFIPNASILAYGFTGGMAAIHGPFIPSAVTAGVITIPTGSTAADAAGESVTLVTLVGGTFFDIFQHSVLDIYSGNQPADADTTESGTKLVSITNASGAFSAGAVTNGLVLDAFSAGTISKEPTQTWSGNGLATGTAGWARLYDNNYTTGTSTTARRLDFRVAVSGAELNLTTTSITSGLPVSITIFKLTLPNA